MPESDYAQLIIEKRQAREKHLVANPRNWFSLVGLFPLFEGENILGGDTQNSVNIPGIISSQCATFNFSKGKVSLVEASGNLLLNDNPATSRIIQSDHDPEPDLLSFGPIQIMLLRRGERFFLRAWDTQSERVKNFGGLNYFKVDPSLRINAKYSPFKEPRSLPVEDAIGTRYSVNFIGRAEFVIGGTSCSMIAEEDEDGLLFSFKDLTSQDSTYGAGRYVLTDPPTDDQVIIDFNLANNWPCAYTPYATCPLPPSENHLKVRIEAGEKRYQ
jgi:uncharacterized protein